MLLNHLCVNATSLILKRIMCAILNNSALLEHDNTIGFFNSRKAMGNDNCSDFTAKFGLHLVNSFLHFCLIGFIKGTRCFIENEHLWLLDESASKSKALLLATRELATTCSNVLVDSQVASFSHKAP